MFGVWSVFVSAYVWASYSIDNEYHISWIWQPIQKPSISLFNPPSDRQFPDRDLPGTYFLDLATLPETIDFVFQSFIKSTISWPNSSETVFPGCDNSSKTCRFRNAIVYQKEHFPSQTFHNHISWIVIYIVIIHRKRILLKMHDAWCIVFGAWCMVQGAGCMVHGACCIAHGAWCLVHGAWCKMLVPLRVPPFPDPDFPKPYFLDFGDPPRNPRFRCSILSQIDHFLTGTFQEDHISWIWQPFQKPSISLFNPSSDRQFPDRDLPGSCFLDLPSLPETIDFVLPSFNQIDHFLTQLLQDHISCVWQLFQKLSISPCNCLSNRTFPKPNFP